MRFLILTTLVVAVSSLKLKSYEAADLSLFEGIGNYSNDTNGTAGEIRPGPYEFQVLEEWLINATRNSTTGDIPPGTFMMIIKEWVQMFGLNPGPDDQDIMNAFNHFDQDKNGLLNEHEIIEAFKQLK